MGYPDRNRAIVFNYALTDLGNQNTKTNLVIRSSFSTLPWTNGRTTIGLNINIIYS